MGISMLANYMNLSSLSIDHLMEARLLIEPAIAEAAAKRISADGISRLTRLLEEHELDFATHGGSKRGWEFYILLAELSGNTLMKVIEELLIRLFMDAEFSLSIGDIGMTEEEIAYNAEVLPSNRRVAAAVMSGDPARARQEMESSIRGFTDRISRFVSRHGAGSPPTRVTRS
jgi:DNA-binding FadR family transcriptional regulator